MLAHVATPLTKAASAAAASAYAAARHELRWRCISTSAGVQPLASILKLPLLQDKTREEVEHIWLAAHEGSSTHVASVISAEEYGVLAPRAADSPLFVLPLRKPAGASAASSARLERSQRADHDARAVPCACYVILSRGISSQASTLC